MKQIKFSTGFHMFAALAATVLIGLCSPSQAQNRLPATALVPDSIPEPTRSELNKERVPIEATRYLLRERAKDQNAKCDPAPDDPAAKQTCKERQQRFNDDLADLIWSVRNFNLTVKGYLTIAAMNALAKKLPDWTTAERSRLEKALNALDVDGNKDKTLDEINRVWKDMLARGDAFAAEADKGKGPGMPGAGQQTKHQDCAVFALANASGQPYGVVAARLIELMRDGDWRDAKEHADLQKVIEDEGLMGGEVVMMAEALGRVEIVNSNNFAKTLEGGRTVMINVHPNGGGAHEVVLTKTFRHDGETWFEMMDSNQGPIRRLYLSHKELMMILKETGVAYSPEPGNTPKLLR